MSADKSIDQSIDRSINQSKHIRLHSDDYDNGDDVCYRGWLVNPVAVTHWWLILVAILPALLATILVFLDQQITAVIVNRSEHKLKVRVVFLSLFLINYFKIY